ncbi:hypothetical protein N182_36440 [Sinorhizobium sp. GL2]|nr:hypothetical protein N182_36440 [Sinorhizobium sp. GL2]
MILFAEDFTHSFMKATARSKDRGLAMLSNLYPRGTVLVEGILAFAYAHLGMCAEADLHAQNMANLITDKELGSSRADSTAVVLCELHPRDLVIENSAIRIDMGHNNIPSLLKEIGFDVVHVWPHQLDADPIGELFDRAVAVINCYSDADRPGALTASHLHGRQIVNTPESVKRSRRDAISNGLAHVNPDICHIPPTMAVGDVPADFAHGPILAREGSAHSGFGLALLPSIGDVVSQCGREFRYVTPFVETRWADGLYRKCRAIFVCGEIVVEHMMVSNTWCVRSSVARPFMSLRPETKDEELAFLSNWRTTHPSIAEVVAEIAKVTLLDFFIADIGLKPDGGIVLFEANPVARIILQSELSEEGMHLEENVLAIQQTFKRRVINHGKC